MHLHSWSTEKIAVRVRAMNFLFFIKQFLILLKCFYKFHYNEVNINKFLTKFKLFHFMGGANKTYLSSQFWHRPDPCGSTRGFNPPSFWPLPLPPIPLKQHRPPYALLPSWW